MGALSIRRGPGAGLPEARRAIHHNDTQAGIDGKTTAELLRGSPTTPKRTLGVKSENLLVQLFTSELLL